MYSAGARTLEQGVETGRIPHLGEALRARERHHWGYTLLRAMEK